MFQTIVSIMSILTIAGTITTYISGEIAETAIANRISEARACRASTVLMSWGIILFLCSLVGMLAALIVRSAFGF